MTKCLNLLTVALATALVAVSGCRCGGTTPPRSFGEMRIVYTDETGTTLAGENGIYNFGQVPMGKTETLKLVVTNSGLGVLTLSSFEKLEGDPVLATPGVNEANPVFTVSLGDTGQVDIPSGATREFDITFTPPQSTATQEPHRALIALKALNTEAGKDTARIELLGVGVSGTCDLPAEIDFGAVARGDTFSRTLRFENNQPIDTKAYVGNIESAQGTGIFTLTAESPRGEFTIVAGRSKDVTIVFAPTEARDYFGNVRMRRAEGCPEKQVRLIGTGVDQVLTWAPATVDLGYVTPGLEVEGVVTFSNRSLREVQLSALATFEGNVPSSVFKVTAASMGDLTRQTVPAAVRDPVTRAITPGNATVKMSFKPLVLGPRTGTLRANTDLRNQSSIVVPLRGVGGGPDIDVRPSPTLNFGRIAYFPNANPPSFATRKLTVQNVGTRPNPPDPRANLKLGKPDGQGGFAKPYWEITPKNADSSLSEICIGAFDSMAGRCLDDLPAPPGPGSYDPAIGIEATGTAAILDIPVRITPSGTGMKEWEVKIYSNDPDEPVTTVTIQANAVTLPPCQAQITPLALNFGVVSPPSTKDLGFQIRNLGTQPSDICLVTNVQLQPESGTPPGMPPVFSLPAGEVNEQELQPGEVMQVLVRAWPQGQLPPNPATVTGRVQFNLSNPTTPQGTVNLSATIAPSCLAISPSDLDFGTVQKDCNSPNRTFQIYNTCSQTVTINSTQMVAAAGEPPGGPNCPGTSPCPEFFVTTNISPLPYAVQPGGSTPVTFELKYRPINYGPDTGAFVVRATQGGQSVDYVVTLRGQGDTMGLNTDTFRQDAKPKADILLVIDDSCSMSDKQMSLATNFNSFIKYAQSSQVDFQIGITTTDPTPGIIGRLKRGPSGVKILKPTTPNLEQEFRVMVNVGIDGSATESCMEPAVAALTAPLITDPNANLGLLRLDAVLAVVCVTDAQDQAVQPASFYLNQLMNIKGAQRPGLFTYNVVGPFLASEPPGCVYDGSPDDGKHAFMVNSTNGVKEEICTPDWAKALENIGKNAFGFRTNFYLTARPDLTSMRGITVAIDGVQLDPTDARGAKVWEYDPTNNSINFEPLYVPEPGKTLTVTYQVACIP